MNPRTDTHTPVVGEWVYWYAPHELPRRMCGGIVVRMIAEHNAVCVNDAGRAVVVHCDNLLPAKAEGVAS